MVKISNLFQKTRANKLAVTSLFFACIVFLYLFISSTLYFRIGNIFFGDMPSLYNVKFAEFFYTRAVHPLFGKAPEFAYHQLSRTHFIQGELELSLEEAYTEIEMYPEHVQTYYIIGLTLGYLNREREAIDAFGKFIEYKPGSWAARNDRAWLQFRIGDIDGAMETIIPIVSIHQTNPWVQNTYGTLLLNKERYEEAKEAFSLAKQSADQMTEESWGRAYPGNDPRIYATGLNGMRLSIENNLRLVDQKFTPSSN